MSDHLGKPGTPAGWALHLFTGTVICEPCGWWAHEASRPKDTMVSGYWCQDNAAKALPFLYPEHAAEITQHVINDTPKPDMSRSQKEYKHWANSMRKAANRRLALRHRDVHQELATILAGHWAEKLAA